MSKGASRTSFALNSGDFLGKLVSQPSALHDEQEVATGWIPVEQIQKGRFQPRQYFSKESINKLAQSFKKHGFRGAINVRPLPNGMYELVAGERRWLAAKHAGLEKIRAIIDHYSDEEALEFGLVENLQREDLSKLEETEGILKLIETKLEISCDRAIALIRTEGHSDKRNRSDVAPSQELQKIEALLSYFNIELQTFRTKNLRTLSLPKELKQGHLEQNLPYSCALELSKIKDEEERKALLEEAIGNKLSFRDIKERVQKLAGKGRGDREAHPLVRRFEATVKRLKTTEHLFEQEQKKKQLELLLNKLESLLKEGD